MYNDEKMSFKHVSSWNCYSEELRALFSGDADHVVNFFNFLADLREIMAELGFKTVDEMIGRTDMLAFDEEKEHWLKILIFRQFCSDPQNLK